MRYLFTVLLTTLWMGTTTQAQTTAVFTDEVFSYDETLPAVGVWLGNLTKDDKTRGVPQIVIERDAKQQWSVKLTLLEFGAMDQVCEEVEIDDHSVIFTFALPGAKVRFTGHIDETGQRLIGIADVLENGEVNPDKQALFQCDRTLRPIDLSETLAFSGDLKLPQMGKLGLTLVFAVTPGGNWVGHMDVPIQGITGLPLVNIESDGESIKAVAPVPGSPATIDARFEDDQQRLVGRFIQGIELELNLVRDTSYAGPKLNRPQHPQPPFPYVVREVTVKHPDGHTLAGSLTLPSGNGPFPAAVMITGSGAQDRDETLLGHKPFLVIADHLTRHGIAVLRCDDRGMGDSTGDFSVATSQDFATDALASFNFLKEVTEIDAQRIGLIGHSEGGMIAPIVATMIDDVAFAVLLAGVGVPGYELLVVQMEKLLIAAEVPEPQRNTQMAQQREFLRMVKDGATVEELRVAMRPVIAAQFAAIGVADDEQIEQAINQQLDQITNNWWRYFVTFDPRPVLSKVTCPVLAMNGTLDLQVWHEQNLPAIEKAIKSGGGNITIKRYEGLNHLFQPAQTGSIAEYGVIETTFDEQVLQDMTKWIQDVTKGS